MKHLNRDRWMRRTSTGTWMLKRVSAARNEQFPKHLREMWRDHGPARVVRQLVNGKGLTIAEAWDRLKHMAND